jgi:hypothetical protein
MMAPEERKGKSTIENKATGSAKVEQCVEPATTWFQSEVRQSAVGHPLRVLEI